MQGEEKKLTEEIYKEFVRNGALLPEDKMARMKEINMRISELQQQWGDQLPAATNDAVVWVDKKEDLAGLSEADIAQCQKDAESRGSKAPYAIVIVNTTQQAILASLDNRELRKKVFESSIHRADGTSGRQICRRGAGISACQSFTPPGRYSGCAGGCARLCQAVSVYRTAQG